MFKSFITLIKRNKDVIKYGVVTNTTIGILLRGCGDVIQQNIELKNDCKKEKSILVYPISESKLSSKSEINSEAKQKFDWTRTSKTFRA